MAVKSGLFQDFSPQERRQVRKVQFSVMDPEEIKSLSVCEVNDFTLFDVETKEPKPNSLLDPRLGPCLKGNRCLTCASDLINCPGHFGHIVLAQPVYHFGFLNIVQKVLSCVCYKCSMLKGYGDPQRKQKIDAISQIQDPSRRLNVLFKLLRSVHSCSKKGSNSSRTHGLLPKDEGCDSLQPNYVVESRDNMGITQVFSKKVDQNLDTKIFLPAEAAYKILSKIPEEQIRILGFDVKRNHPKNMIITILPVAPPQVRPTVERGAGLMSEDDLTYQYQYILRANNRLKDSLIKGEPIHVVTEWVQTLQFYTTTLFKNDYPKRSTHKNGRPIKCFKDRISSKEGRIRGNLMGKRVDFSARTVISPDPNLNLDELGVPRSIAVNLTFPEPVTQRNYEFLQGLVKKEMPWSWPGAKYIKKKTGEIFDLRIAREINLDIGDIVERHIMDGDYVLFNRQPSLHKMSMMAHRIRVLPYSSFRLNLSVTKPYNADFDGDEMNMHVPQSYESRAELKEICYVPKQIVSPKANQPVMGLEQDSLTGVALLSRRNVFLTMDQVMNLSMFLPPELFEGTIPEPAIVKPVKLWTGKQILSLIFPRVNSEHLANGDMVETGKEFDLSLLDLEVLIQKGEILKGIIDNRTVGHFRGGLIHVIWLEYGPEATKRFLTDSQRIINNWLAGHGFSVGISDTIADQETFELVEKTLEKSKKEVGELFQMTQRGDLEFQPGKGLLDSLEQQVNQSLNESRDLAGNKLLQRVEKRNNILHMINAGSKGKKENLCQILACVGQQNIEGRRIGFGFTHRTLPHFNKYDFGPRSKGFVESCYLKGLSPEEFFFHTMGGREGLIDTAVKTSETGYIQRKLVKSIEDAMVAYDNTVRDSRGNVIQFIYGEDGMSGEFIEEVKMDLVEYSDETLIKKFEISYRDNLVMEEEDELLHQQELDQLRDDRNFLRGIFPDFRVKYFLPANIARLIKNAKSEFKIRPKDVSNLQVKEVLERVQDLLARLSSANSRRNNTDSLTLLSIYIRFMLASKKIILVERLSEESFNWLLGQIESHFHRAKVHPGENVGAIAAQSISEPTTQMTLNTFHMAGISSKNVTLGVPRIKEILNNVLSIRTPSLTIHLKEPYKYQEKFFHKASHDFSYSMLRNLAFKSQIFFDADPLDSIIEEHESFNLQNELFYLNPQVYYDLQQKKVSVSPWVLRIILNKEIDVTNATMIEILVRSKVSQALKAIEFKIKFVVLTNNFLLALSEDQHPVIRIIMIREFTEPLSFEAEILKRIEREILDEIPICGIEKVKKLYSKQIKRDKQLRIDPFDGSLEPESRDTYYYETDGSNLQAVFSVEYVDHTKTVTNVVPEILKVLGIEAARKSLIQEIRRVISHYGIYINYRHLALLCDVMCHRGYIMPINRNGINRIDSGPLRKCSFEETLDMILEAATFGTSDPLKGVSEKIMLGQLCRIGTGSFDLLIDGKKIVEPRYLPDAYIEQEAEFERMNAGIAGIPADNAHNFHDLNTPINPITPQAFIASGLTPALSTIYHSDHGTFTPNMSLNSPLYSPLLRPSSSRFTSPRVFSGSLSPLYLEDSQSLMFSSSPFSALHSPSYTPGTPGSRPSYNPTSPHYSASNSPSLSSSGGTGTGTKIYSPSSPKYSSSPRYSPGYSPRSPSYNSPPSSKTPSSQDAPMNYTPNTPTYQRGGVYVPTSPAYDPSRVIEEETSSSRDFGELFKDFVGEDEDETNEEISD